MASLKTASCIETPQVINVDLPFSNFSFIEKVFGCNLYPIQRIFSQARTYSYRTLVLEKIESTGYSKEDDLDLQEAGLKISSLPLYRISFFNSKFNTISEIEKQGDSNFLGYVILKNILYNSKSSWIVFESVLRQTDHRNNYLHTKRSYEVKINKFSFTVEGSLYCQQNGLTNCCAHAALRTCLAVTLPSNDFSYREMNNILRNSDKPHKVREPLTLLQILAILDHLEIQYSTYHSKKAINIPYQSFLYGSIESGFPALLGFLLAKGSVGHMIPILGHTFNEDTWVPDADVSYFEIGKDTRYIPSESWVSSYICHDDNFGSYYCIPREYLSHRETYIISVRSKYAKYDAVDAEAIAVEYLYTLIDKISLEINRNEWMNRLIRASLDKKGRVALRTIYLTSKRYIEHLKAIKGWDGQKIDYKLLDALEKQLFGYLWVIEVSLPELFPANRRKLGEIVLNPSIAFTSDRDLSSFVFARLLDKIYFMELAEDKSIKLSTYPAGIDTHSDIYQM